MLKLYKMAVFSLTRNNNAVEIKLYHSYFIFLFTVFTQTTDTQSRYLDVIRYIVFSRCIINLTLEILDFF